MLALKSKITRAILNYFFMNPKASMYVNELQRKFNLDKRNLVKKLKDLEKESILHSRTQGNQRIYFLNMRYPLYNEYKKIVLKSIGIESKLKMILNTIPGIKAAYIYGSYVKDAMDISSDIDLLVVGSHSILLLQRKINKLQKEIDREINIINMNKTEFRARKKKQDLFIKNIFTNKTVRIV